MAQQPESLDVARLYQNGDRATQNSDAEFWHEVALRLGKLDAQRARAARRVARYTRLVRRTAAERDAHYRAQIEALQGKRET